MIDINTLDYLLMVAGKGEGVMLISAVTPRRIAAHALSTLVSLHLSTALKSSNSTFEICFVVMSQYLRDFFVKDFF